MRTDEFDYRLPVELIAQNPSPDRMRARLMVLRRNDLSIEHRHIGDLGMILSKNDVLVFNQTKVFPARLKGRVPHREKSVEVLLHRPVDGSTWECLVKPGKAFTQGVEIKFKNESRSMEGTVIGIQGDGTRLIRFSKKGSAFDAAIDALGETPLPPYIKHSTAPPSAYQTVYAVERGSVAAPTAGLHFTKELLKTLTQKGVKQAFVTLHVGRGTFEPVKAETLEAHRMHRESFKIDSKTAETLNKAKSAEKRIIAVGTTTTRVLESCAKNGLLQARSGETELFITPGYDFQFVDALLTNFHLPKSTLLMMISAFAGKNFIQRAYLEAIEKKYRFFSFGDAMLIL